MITIAITLFVIGYLFIALEHNIRIDKSASALVLGVLMWTIYAFFSETAVPFLHSIELEEFIHNNPNYASLSKVEQCFKFISEQQLLHELGDIASTVLFLIGAMSIVEMIDVHGGFSFITNYITTKDKKTLLWVISILSFFMSAALDNMTTSIVMVMLVGKLVSDQKERWVFASMVIVAANSGGAWSPIGDITTIMLWMKGTISTSGVISSLFIPCVVSTVVPVLFASKVLHGIIQDNISNNKGSHTIENVVSKSESKSILFVGVALLICVPLFKEFVHLPPVVGIMGSLGLFWLFTDCIYKKKNNVPEENKMRINKVIHKIDMSTIMFFVGILLAVGALKEMGILGSLAKFLEDEVGNVYVIGYVIGVVSSIVDNVPLVAAATGMYPVVSPEMVSTMANPEFMANFVKDGIFWQFLAYCSGVGGSLLIIGSVSGVVVMGIEKINFVWYFKHITLMVLLGYTAGAITYVVQALLIG